MMVVQMGRCLAVVCVLAGCGFDASINPGNPDGSAPDDASVAADAAVDAPADARTGSEAMPPESVELTSVADIYLRTGAAPDQNTNSVDYFIVDGDIQATGLVRFDLSSIPASATVDAAELILWNDGDSGELCSVYQMLEAWDEATATSNQRATGMAWLGAGATPPSRGTIAIGAFTPATQNTAYPIAIELAVVQAWVTTSSTNHGLAIVTAQADGSRFKTRETSTAARRPMLRVAYTP